MSMRQNINRTTWIVSQASKLVFEHEMMWAEWKSNNPLKRMLERVCWRKHSKIESWSCYVCLVMKCSKEGRQAHITKGKKPQALFSCCWKGREQKSMWTKASNKKLWWSNRNWKAKDEKKSQLPKKESN
jgi:hypothetical protein